eukprot:CAMPEP_0206317430 /NCGR_PEP_ID=MMETSP0106_2-20121207/16636_1 /ASSEMBLY_ACC=CAM_ASM_000206 /TAXON_ID=81532 /ORGANISM="Acanthoeca-like sp., Strain 10tr" /LENGTH=1281 /DNA_ID=CAMNT_0053749031 /DNA_START=95 /DNA_END=3941 /DNA_ORIENTATION=+
MGLGVVFVGVVVCVAKSAVGKRVVELVLPPSGNVTVGPARMPLDRWSAEPRARPRFTRAGLEAVIGADLMSGLGRVAMGGARVKRWDESQNEPLMRNRRSVCGMVVSIPAGEKTIAANAFRDCTLMTTVTIPSSVTSIGAFAFAGCSTLGAVAVPTTVTHLGIGAFANCTGLVNVTFAATVAAIPDETFHNCTNLARVVGVSNATTTIGAKAFRLCATLSSFDLPNSLAVVNSSAFSNCTQLQTVGTVPSTLHFIGEYAFAGCRALREFDLAQTAVATIELGAFSEAVSLSAVSFPESIRFIGEQAFWGATSLTAVTFSPTTATLTVGTAAFFLTALQAVALPNHTSLSLYAFAGIPQLRTVTAINLNRTESTSFLGCGCSSCPAAMAGGTISMCGCIACGANSTANITDNSAFTTSALGQFFIHLMSVPSDEVLDSTVLFLSNETRIATFPPNDVVQLAEVAMNIVAIVAETDRRTQVTVMTADAVTSILNLLNAYASMVRLLIRRGNATDAMVEAYIMTIGNFTAEFMVSGVNQTTLVKPLVTALDESLLNATEKLVSVQSAGVHTFTSRQSKIGVQVYGTGHNPAGTNGGDAAFSFEFDGFNSTFKVPLSSISSDDDFVGAAFSSYADAKLFKSDLNASVMQLGSSVMAVQITGNLTGNVEGVFDFTAYLNASAFDKYPARLVPSCVYYVEPSSGSAVGHWSPRGCWTKIVNETHAQCVCNHLTSFAVLVSDREQSTTDAKALSVITYVGVGVSLVCILVTVGTLATVDLLRNQLRYRILCNLVISIGFSLVMFTLISTPKGKIECSIVSGLTQYFFTATFLWNLIDSFDLYQTFVVVFNNGKIRDGTMIVRFRWLAWGGALVPPILAHVVDPSNFITTREARPPICWINMSSDLKWAFLGPVFTIVGTASFTTAAIVRAIRRSRSHRSFHSALYTARVIISLSSVTGLTWLFAVMVVITDEVAFSYLFAIFASLQGAVIFYFHVYQNTLSRTAWRDSMFRLTSLTSGSRGRLLSRVAYGKSHRRGKGPNISHEDDSARNQSARHSSLYDTNNGNKTMPWHRVSSRPGNSIDRGVSPESFKGVSPSDLPPGFTHGLFLYPTSSRDSDADLHYHSPIASAVFDVAHNPLRDKNESSNEQRSSTDSLVRVTELHIQQSAVPVLEKGFPDHRRSTMSSRYTEPQGGSPCSPATAATSSVCRVQSAAGGVTTDTIYSPLSSADYEAVQNDRTPTPITVAQSPELAVPLYDNLYDEFDDHLPDGHHGHHRARGRSTDIYVSVV